MMCSTQKNRRNSNRRSAHLFRCALAIDSTYHKAVTLSLLRGESVYYILTDASDFAFAREGDI